MNPTDQTRIFISYGRRDAAAFVDQLERDLKEAGFAIWRDTTDIQGGGAWDAQIAAALKQSDVVVAVLTPHAVRGGRAPGASEDESVCLDELHAARFDKPPTPIVPIMLVQCETPWIIARLHWLEFEGTDTNPAKYRVAFERLVQTIRDVEGGKPVPHRTIDLDPLDFDLYLKAKTRDFVGREWLAKDIVGWLDGPNAATALLLVGEPGWGKTAFCGYLFGRDPGGQLLAVHFCRADRADTVSPRGFVQSIAAMTALRLPAYRERLHAVLQVSPEIIHSGNSLQMLERIWLQPLAALDPNLLSRLPRYVLVDALDEAASSESGHELHSLLAKATGMFPPWLRLIATTRDRFGIPRSFPNARIVNLSTDDARNRDDIRRLIEQQLAGGDSAIGIHETLMRVVETKAEGNALCAAQLAAAVRNSGLDARAIAALPAGLSALYQAMFEARFDPHGSQWREVRSILELVLATDAPVPISLIAEARADSDEYATRQTVALISDLLVNESDSIQVFHQTLNDFFNDRANPYFVNRRSGATKLAEFTVRAKRAGAAEQIPLQALLSAWITRSDDPGRFADQLPRLYERVFSREFGFYDSGPSDEEFDEHRRLIAAFATAGRVDDLIGIVELAMARAYDPLSRIHEPFNRKSASPNPDDARLISEFIWITNFTFEFIREILRLQPNAKPKLRAAFLRHEDYLGFFTFLGPDLGYRKLGLSGYYEQEGDWIYNERRKLKEDLE